MVTANKARDDVHVVLGLVELSVKSLCTAPSERRTVCGCFVMRVQALLHSWWRDKVGSDVSLPWTDLMVDPGNGGA
jgi:hypothetical protein